MEVVFQGMDTDNSRGVNESEFIKFMRKKRKLAPAPDHSSQSRRADVGGVKRVLSLVGLNGATLKRTNMRFIEILDAIQDTPRPIILKFKWLTVDKEEAPPVEIDLLGAGKDIDICIQNDGFCI